MGESIMYHLSLIALYLIGITFPLIGATSSQSANDWQNHEKKLIQQQYQQNKHLEVDRVSSKSDQSHEEQRRFEENIERRRLEDKRLEEQREEEKRLERKRQDDKRR